MATARVRIKINGDYSLVPVVIPGLEELRRFADALHRGGKPWKGEAFGWHAEYNPERSEKPLDSKMSFTPADFCVAESNVWFFSLMWEHGGDAAAVEFVDDRNIIAEGIA